MKTLKFIKSECGLDVLLNVELGTNLKHLYLYTDVYNSDWFEVLFFKKGKGKLILNQRKLEINDNIIVFISKL